MPASVIQNNKARDAARVFYVSWAPTERGADKAGPRNCASALKAQLEPVGMDQAGRTISKVIDSAPGALTAGVKLTAGVPLTTGGDAELTDFVALMTAEYATLNKASPDDGGTGELAFALKELQQAGEAAGPLAIWTAAIDASSKGQRANWTIAGRRFGEIDGCHALTTDNALRTSPAKALEKDVSAVVDHLLGFSTCPLCAGRFRSGG
jgi:hypothetical protein